MSTGGKSGFYYEFSFDWIIMGILIHRCLWKIFEKYERTLKVKRGFQTS